MALYHLHVKNISRGDGRSAVAAAAYRAGETLENAAEERLSKFAGRRDVLGAEIHLPANAPAWMADRAVLWNAVEAIERRKDARLAKEVEFSLPRELPREAWFAVARSMAAHFTAQGFVVDLAVHDDGTGHNPHVHLLLATRLVTPDGFGPKLRAADRKTFLKDTRTAWQAIANAALEKAGIPVKIDAGSYAARGIDREPGEHRPPDPAARRRRREEVTSMLRDSDISRAIAELAADPSAKERYPTLSRRPEWPPRERVLGPVLTLSPEARERKAYWQEVEQRADPSALSNADQAHEPARDDLYAEGRSLDDEVNTLAGKIQAATLKQGQERRQAFIEGAREYEKLHRHMNREMVRARVLKPENVRSWEQVSRAFRDPEFDDLLAEARRLEAKRQEPDRTLRATPQQIAAVVRLEAEMASREGTEITPRSVVRPAEPLRVPPAPAQDQRRSVDPDHGSPVQTPVQEQRLRLDPDEWQAERSKGPSPTPEPAMERRVRLDPDEWQMERDHQQRSDRDRERDQERERDLERER
ncbi:MobQ family relaxase [Methylorubrum sp. SB2]|uniref:MobQ family relaxase n=1 Tax=Methylorubrum subtropicum TaxID=3138812 RepID=UPI00313C80E7